MAAAGDSTTTLVSFLGRGAPDRQRRYREANYHFEGHGDRRTRFFGLALNEVLAPDRLVILGTRGSMWDVLLVEELELSLESSQVEAMIDAANDDRVTRELLAEFEAPLGEAMGLPVALDIIPYGTSAAEQQQAVAVINQRVAEADRVHIDVTHGLRHLPMISLAAAQVIESIGQQKVAGIHYGALELTREGSTPVVELDGLLSIQHWLAALHTFEKDGDYSVFADLLAGSCSEKAINNLRLGAFFERTNNVFNARKALGSARAELEAHEPTNPLESIFLPKLIERLGWITGGTLAQRQLGLAEQHFRNGDFLRAAILGYEALTTAVVQEAGDQPGNFHDRQNANEKLKKQSKQNRRGRAAHDLRKIRHALVHAEPGTSGEAGEAVMDPDKLRALLGDRLRRIKNFVE